MATVHIVHQGDVQGSRFRGHSEVNCSAGGVIAQIPWLPKRPQSIAFKESGCFRRYFALSHNPVDPSEMETEEFWNEMKDIMAEAFPFFLPTRYHSMDATKLHKCAVSTGSYWTNAILLLRTCGDLGTLIYRNIDKQLDRTSFSWKRFGFAKALVCKFQDFKKGAPEQCKTAAEFLLDPWVLLQLPFQPTLLHQWTVGVLAENLRFAKKLVHIFTRGVAQQFVEVLGQMKIMSQELYKNCSHLFSYFFNVCCFDIEENLSTRMNKFLAALPEFLAPVLTYLEFIMSDDCTNVLNSIMCESWSPKLRPHDLNSNIVSSSPELLCRRYFEQTFVYSDKYWTTRESRPNAPTLCTTTPDSFTDNLRSQEKKAESLKAILKNNPTFNDKQCKEHLKRIKTFVIQEILKDDSPLQGLTLRDADGIVRSVEQHLSEDGFVYFMRDLAQWESLKDIDGRAANVEKGGVLIDLLSLEADIRAEHVLGSLTRVVWCAVDEFYGKQVYLHLEACYAPLGEKFSAPDIRLKLQRLKQRKKIWSPKNLIVEAKKSCTLGEPTKESGSNAVYLVKKFTRRIRLLLVQIYELHYANTSVSPHKFQPEYQFVQYLLPCFVAMILDVERDPNVDPQTKMAYTQFVDELIQNFEERPYVQILADKKRREIFHASEFFDRDLKIQLNDVVSTLAAAFKNSPSLQSTVQKIMLLNTDSFGKVLDFFSLPSKNENLAKKSDLFETTDSKIQLSRFCFRLNDSLEKVGWSAKKQPNFIDFPYVFSILTKQETLDIEKIIKLRLAQHHMTGIQLQFFLAANNVPRTNAMGRQSHMLTAPQLCGIAICLTWMNKMSPVEFFSSYQKPLFDLDPLQLVTNHFLNSDWWNIMKLMAPYMKATLQTDLDLGLVPLQIFFKNACCRPLLSVLSPGKERVKMRSPGEVTFCPIQHCRWCGLVNARPFRLCAECQDEPDYPHPNYFCSEKCEKTALNKCHTEEHARFIMEKLGLC